MTSPTTSATPWAAAVAAVTASAPRFDLRAAIRRLEAAATNAAPIGRLGPVAREVVRLRPVLSLAFPTAEIAGAVHRASEGGERVEVTTAVMGLYGTVSPLPAYITERLLVQDEEALPRGLIDLLHHRVLSLLYRALTKYRGAFPQAASDGERHAERLQALAGVAPEQPDTGVPRGALLAWAGLLARQPRGAETVELVIADWFGTPCRVDQCVPRWTDLPPETLTRLGLANGTLGSDAVAGERVYNRATTFHLELGPVGWDAAASFQPGGTRFAELRALVDLLNADALDWGFTLVIDTADMPHFAADDARARLGWTTRLEGSGERYHRLTIAMT